MSTKKELLDEVSTAMDVLGAFIVTNDGDMERLNLTARELIVLRHFILHDMMNERHDYVFCSETAKNIQNIALNSQRGAKAFYKDFSSWVADTHSLPTGG